MSRFSAILLGLVALGLFACGGGGGPDDTAKPDVSGDVPVNDARDTVPDEPDVTSVDAEVDDGPCEPACGGKACGDDGCGGQCGTCGAGKVCDDQGQCVDEPPECTLDADCAGECGALATCQACGCNNGACAKEAVPGCCTTDAQCFNKCSGLDACHTCGCSVDNDCDPEPVAGCCLDSLADCPSGFVCKNHKCEPEIVLCNEKPDPDAFCAANQMCGVVSGYCQQCACDGGSGLCGVVSTRGNDCCIDAVADCDDGIDATLNECPVPGGACQFPPCLSCCQGVSSTFLNANFDQGSLAQFDVINDNDPNDAVTWRLDGSAPHSGSYAVYFGDPACHTYYTGAVDAFCKPVSLTQEDAKRVRAGLRTKTIALGACVYALVFWARFEGEAPWPPPLQSVDQLKITVTSGSDAPVQVFASASNTDTNSTGGQWRQFVADLTAWTNRSIQITFTFDSVDGNDNLHYGVMLDDIVVRSLADVSPCTTVTCPADGKQCTSDACTYFTNGAADAAGVCAYLNDDPDCTDCTQDSQCAGAQCMTGTCVEGKCAFGLDEVCCKSVLEGVTQLWDFGAGFGGWTVKDASDTTVAWHEAPGKGVGGTGAVYFGDPDHPCAFEPAAVCPSYDNGLKVKGTLESPSVVLPANAAHQLFVFDLKLSTEWNGQVGAISNAGGLDRLTLWGRAGNTTTPLWTSDAIGGNTTVLNADGAWVSEWRRISVDVSMYQGQAVAFGFTFDTGDYNNNDNEGVFLDNVSLVVACAEPCATNSDCNDNKPCTADTCNAGICEHQTVGECCTTVADCDDGNDCTADQCAGFLCKHPYKVDASCCQEGTINGSVFDFETASLPDTFAVTGPAGATATWQIGSAHASQGSSALWFGNAATGGYENLVNGVSVRSEGTVELPWFKVPFGGTSVLEFDLYLDTDWMGIPALWDPPTVTQYDKLSVYANGVEIWNSYVYELAGSTCGTGCKFVPVQASLVNFANENVTLAFRFDSADGGDNDGAGVFVDNLRATWLCADYECFSSFECDDPGDPTDECTRDRCESKQCFFSPTGAAGCCYPTDVATQGFEGSLEGVTLSSASGPVKWQAASKGQGATVHGGEKGLYFGDLGNKTYADGDKAVSGTAAWALNVPGAGYRLEWWQWLGLDTDDLTVPVSDVFTVRVFDPTNPTDLGVVFQNKPSFGFYHTWSRQSVSLDSWAGKAVVVRFEFASGDGQNNQGEGVYVDDLRVYKPCE